MDSAEEHPLLLEFYDDLYTRLEEHYDSDKSRLDEAWVPWKLYGEGVRKTARELFKAQRSTMLSLIDGPKRLQGDTRVGQNVNQVLAQALKRFSTALQKKEVGIADIVNSHFETRASAVAPPPPLKERSPFADLALHIRTGDGAVNGHVLVQAVEKWLGKLLPAVRTLSSDAASDDTAAANTRDEWMRAATWKTSSDADAARLDADAARLNADDVLRQRLQLELVLADLARFGFALSWSNPKRCRLDNERVDVLSEDDPNARFLTDLSEVMPPVGNGDDVAQTQPQWKSMFVTHSRRYVQASRMKSVVDTCGLSAEVVRDHTRTIDGLGDWLDADDAAEAVRAQNDHLNRAVQSISVSEGTDNAFVDPRLTWSSLMLVIIENGLHRYHNQLYIDVSTPYYTGLISHTFQRYREIFHKLLSLVAHAHAKRPFESHYGGARFAAGVLKAESERRAAAATAEVGWRERLPRQLAAFVAKERGGVSTSAPKAAAVALAHGGVFVCARILLRYPDTAKRDAAAGVIETLGPTHLVDSLVKLGFKATPAVTKDIARMKDKAKLRVENDAGSDRFLTVFIEIDVSLLYTDGGDDGVKGTSRLPVPVGFRFNASFVDAFLDRANSTNNRYGSIDDEIQQRVSDWLSHPPEQMPLLLRSSWWLSGRSLVNNYKPDAFHMHIPASTTLAQIETVGLDPAFAGLRATASAWSVAVDDAEATAKSLDANTFDGFAASERFDGYVLKPAFYHKYEEADYYGLSIGYVFLSEPFHFLKIPLPFLESAR